MSITAVRVCGKVDCINLSTVIGLKNTKTSTCRRFQSRPDLIRSHQIHTGAAAQSPTCRSGHASPPSIRMFKILSSTALLYHMVLLPVPVVYKPTS